MRLLFFWFLITSALAQEPSAPFSKIIVIGQVDLIGFEWKDLELEKETQFTAPLLRNWEKWLTENRPKSVAEILGCDAICLQYHAQWLEKSPEEVVKNPDPQFHNILWIKISLHIRRNVIDKRQNYIWDGRVLVIDGNTKHTFATVTLPKEEKEWVNLSQNEVNTGLVSRVYRTPLGAFPSLNQRIEKILPLNRVIKLVISGHRNMGDVSKLIEVLQTRGSFLGLVVELGQIQSQEVILRGSFRGEEKSFTDLLSQVKELKSSNNYSLINEQKDGHYVIRMVKE